ncbi:hypothetical protein EVB27_012 [Rhizobium phage RHph_TM16]|nr:hypothetical protein EVB27_012 [Rhizobium phage RHph_TM16]
MLSILISLASCTITDSQYFANKKAAAEARAREDSLKNMQPIIDLYTAKPTKPEWCQYKVQTEVKPTDPNGVVIVKLDTALTKANNRITACWQWDQDTQKS